MQQVGKVIEVFDNHQAKLLMTKHAACESCGACHRGKENMNMNIIAFNEVDAQIGDTVEVDMETQSVLGAAFIVYVIPLFTLLAGLIGGNYLLKKIGFTRNIEIHAAGIGLIMMGLTFLIIKLFDNVFKKDQRYIPAITKIVKDIE
jgi:sigma-E factor negative regulatory protein RseC